MSGMETLLSLKGITFSYAPGLPVLNGISCEILPGTVNVILGPNGAGKSTLLHLILGLHHPREGTIELEGHQLASYARISLSRLISLVPQREAVPFEYTVHEYILLGRTPHLGYFTMPGKNDLVVVNQVLERLDLKHLADRQMNTLSGGEQQLVLIGRALVQESRLLLLDEPTAHLDLGNKKRILSLMSSLANEGMTILFSTHDPESASVIADSLILMRKGHILKQGGLDQTFTTKLLSETYNTGLKVVDENGQKVVLLNLDGK
jgi:iron complex transport system ATP-binding protein